MQPIDAPARTTHRLSGPCTARFGRLLYPLFSLPVHRNHTFGRACGGAAQPCERGGRSEITCAVRGAAVALRLAECGVRPKSSSAHTGGGGHARWNRRRPARICRPSAAARTSFCARPRATNTVGTRMGGVRGRMGTHARDFYDARGGNAARLLSTGVHRPTPGLDPARRGRPSPLPACLMTLARA